VLLFFTVGYKLEPLEERALETFVDNGGGLVALHCASASFGKLADLVAAHRRQIHRPLQRAAQARHQDHRQQASDHERRRALHHHR